MSHHGVECPEGFSGDPHVFGGTGHSRGHRHGANLGVGESRLTEDAFQYAGIAETERSGLPRNGGREMSAPSNDGSRHGPPAVSIRRGKHNDGDPTARSQDTAPLAQRGRRVRHVHQAEPTQHCIEGSVRQIQCLAVHDARLDLLEPAFFGDLARKFDDAFGDVGRQHVTARANSFGGTDSRLTCAGGDVQDALTGLNPGQVEHLAGHVAIPTIQGGIPASPCRTVLLPLLVLSRSY